MFLSLLFILSSVETTGQFYSHLIGVNTFSLCKKIERSSLGIHDIGFLPISESQYFPAKNMGLCRGRKALHYVCTHWQEQISSCFNAY